MKNKQWVFFSPHFDDVALSCGGIAWDLATRGGHVEIWTIMAGFPPDENFSAFAQKNHHDWGKSGREAIQMRREEDRAACSILGAVPRHFDWLDAIYRKYQESGLPVVNNDDELFNKLPEPSLVSDISKKLSQLLPTGSTLVCPMSLGGHIDHKAVLKACTKLEHDIVYYADYPYILESFDSEALSEPKVKRIAHSLSQEALHAWQRAVLCYQSQLAAFWRDEDEARLALRNYLAGGGGRLWKKN
jgi:LmbE family N-acetylglucosaminyl deacetylase